MTFFVVGLNHKRAPIELREQLAVTASNLVARSTELRLREDLEEVVLLSTCNRVEIYATTRRRGRSTYTVLGSLCAEQHDFRSCAYAYEDMEAVRHLFRVAAGMGSMLLGETEISGQVKQAYETARAAKLTGGTLNRIFQSAFQVVKEIRTRTGIGRGAISVGGASLALAEKIFGHVPRNIDPDAHAIENVYLYNIDDLNAILGENVRNRERELGLCNRIIHDRAAALVQKVCVEQQWRHQTGVPFHAGWICQSAAVVARQMFVAPLVASLTESAAAKKAL